jgi:hypothetical protein
MQIQIRKPAFYTGITDPSRVVQNDNETLLLLPSSVTWQFSIKSRVHPALDAGNMYGTVLQKYPSDDTFPLQKHRGLQRHVVYLADQ